MGKKLIKYLFLALMLCFSVNINVEASDEYNENYSYYTLSDYSVNGTYTLDFGLNHKKKIAAVTGFTVGEGFNGHVDIPSEVKFATDGVTMDTYTVVGVLKTAFKENKSLLSIKLPNTVTFLMDEAFYNCEFLTKVELGTGLEVILSDCFAYCNALSEINLENTKVVELSERTFFDCSYLENITLPESLLYIGEECFCSCDSLDALVLPKKLIGLGDKFIEGTSITTLWIPKTLENVYNAYYGALNGAESLKSVTIEEGATAVISSLFESTSLDEINLPSTLTQLDEGAFYSATLPSNFTLPSNVTIVGKNVFCYATLPNNFVLPDSITDIGESSFYNTSLTSGFKLPSSLKVIGEEAFAYTVFASDLILPEGLEELGYEAFRNAKLYNSVLQLPKSLKKIANDCFSGCDVVEIVVNSDLEYCNNAFATSTSYDIMTGDWGDKTLIEKITISDGVSEVPIGMFANCKVEKIILPDTITTIGDEAFINSGITTINLSNNITFIGADAFNNSSLSGEVVVPSGVEIIKNKVFKDCIYLDSIILGNKVTDIEYEAFRGSAIEKFVIPDSVYYVGENAFSDCKYLKEITLGGNLLNLVNIFGLTGCDSLKKLEIPYGFSSLTDNKNVWDSLYIPESVTSIDDSFTNETVLKIVGVKGSYAETFATENSIPFEEGVAVQDFSFSNAVSELTMDEVFYVFISTTPRNIKDKVTWESSNPTIVSVSNDGELIALMPGMSTITVTIGNLSRSFDVKVLKPIEKIELEPIDIKTVGQKVKLKYNIYPLDAEEHIYFERFLGDCLDILDGDYVVAKSEGSSYIYIKVEGTNEEYDIEWVTVGSGIEKPVITIEDADNSEIQSISWGTISGYEGVEIHKLNEETGEWYLYKDLVGNESGYTLKNFDVYADDISKVSNKFKVRYYVYDVNDEKLLGAFSEEVEYVPSEPVVEESTTSEVDESTEEVTTESPSVEETTEVPSTEETTEEATTEEPSTYPSEEETKNPSTGVNSAIKKFESSKIIVKLERKSNGYYLNWNNIGADKYHIYLSYKNGYSEQWVTASSTSYRLPSNLSPDVYMYTIQGYKSFNGALVYTNESNKVSLTIKPSAVKSLKQKTTFTNKIEMSWGKVTGATGYEIWRATTKNAKYIKVVTVFGTSGKQYVTGGSSYYYKVRAYKKLSDGSILYGSYSTPTKLYSKPSTPKITVKKASKTNIKVSWTKSVGANNYEVYMSNSKSGTYKLVTTRKSTHNKYYTVSNLKKGKTYYFKVRTYKLDGSGNKIYSNWSNVKSLKLPR